MSLSMVQVYCKLVKAESRTIEQVPENLRSEVQVILVSEYVTLIAKGIRIIDQVPSSLRQQVLDELAILGLDESGNNLQ